MTTTTIFCPLSLSLSQWPFINRKEAFAGLLQTAPDALVGFQKRDDAVAAGAARHEGHFALLRLTVSGATQFELAYNGLMTGTQRDRQSGAPLWRLTPEGANRLADPEVCEMTLEIVAAAGEAVKQAPQKEPWRFEPVGPTGFGC